MILSFKIFTHTHTQTVIVNQGLGLQCKYYNYWFSILVLVIRKHNFGVEKYHMEHYN